MAVAPRAPDDPGTGGGDADPGDDFQDGGDAGIVFQNVPTGEDGVPIVIAADDERELQRTGVGHVAGDVEPVFEEPNP